jgi:hypothetical protein
MLFGQVQVIFHCLLFVLFLLDVPMATARSWAAGPSQFRQQSKKVPKAQSSARDRSAARELCVSTLGRIAQR